MFFLFKKTEIIWIVNIIYIRHFKPWKTVNKILTVINHFWFVHKKFRSWLKNIWVSIWKRANYYRAENNHTCLQISLKVCLFSLHLTLWKLFFELKKLCRESILKFRHYFFIKKTPSLFRVFILVVYLGVCSWSRFKFYTHLKLYMSFKMDLYDMPGM